MIEHQMQLEAEEPPHAGFSPGGQTRKNPVFGDPPVVTDRERGSYILDKSMIMGPTWACGVDSTVRADGRVVAARPPWDCVFPELVSLWEMLTFVRNNFYGVTGAFEVLLCAVKRKCDEGLEIP